MGEPTTAQPTKEPTIVGETLSPSTDPTVSPTTLQPSAGPTAQPTKDPTPLRGIDENTTDTSDTWWRENMTWILIVAAVALICCFCDGLACFWYSQHRRTQKRRE